MSQFLPRMLLLLVVLVGLLVLAVPSMAFAQEGDAPPVIVEPPLGEGDTLPIPIENDPDTFILQTDSQVYETIITALIGGIVVVVVVAGYLLRQNGRDAAKSVPPDVLNFLQGITIVALGIAQKHVNKTPGEADNELLATLEKILKLPARDQPVL